MTTDRHLNVVPDLPVDIDPDVPWQTYAACAGMDPDIFFPDEGRGRVDADRWAPAIRVCNTCPVRERCLQDALERNETSGVWGGQTPTQRKRSRQRQSRPSTQTKQCSKCGVVKALYQFHKRANSPDGHKPHCANCVALYDAGRTPRNYSKEARG